MFLLPSSRGREYLSPVRTGDSAPQRLVASIDIPSLEKEHGALGALLNGPRHSRETHVARPTKSPVS